MHQQSDGEASRRMTGNWVPIRCDLVQNPRLQRIARASGRSRHEALGLLVHFWAWASCQTATGSLDGLTVEDLASLIGADLDFWRAVEVAGWLEATDNGLAVPRAEWWLGNGAKARILKNQRQSRWRDGRRSEGVSVDACEARGLDGAQHRAHQLSSQRNREAETRRCGRRWNVYRHVYKPG